MSSLLVFNRVYRLDIQSVMLVFSTPLLISFPSYGLYLSPIPLQATMWECTCSTGNRKTKRGERESLFRPERGEDLNKTTKNSGPLLYIPLNDLTQCSSKQRLAERYFNSIFVQEFCFKSFFSCLFHISLCRNEPIILFAYVIQHCFICRPPDSTVSEDAEIEPSIVATLELTARRPNEDKKHFKNLLKSPF